MTQPLNIIAILGSDLAIGRRGDQPFHISDDFRRFKALTSGHPVIMGRRTFEALPKGALPLRRNIVITANPSWTAPDVETVTSLEAALALCTDGPEPFVIGGGTVYRQALPLATRLFITEVQAEVPDADPWFPAIDPAVWTAAETSPLLTDPRSGLAYRFVEYTRS